MVLTSLRLQNFRSYKDESFELGPNVNIIVGPNASGKTNLIEGIMVVAGGKSFRASDTHLIKKGRAWARLDALSEKGNARTVKIKNDAIKPSKIFEIDSKPYKRLVLDKILPVVLFEPSDLQLLKDEPLARRDYFDNLIEKLDDNFRRARSDYRRTLAQRNRLLKGDPVYARNHLFAWNVRLSELGGQVVAARLDLIKKINKRLNKTYSLLADEATKLKITYGSPLMANGYAGLMLNKLLSSIELDIKRGFTGHGPHREDFLISIASQPANFTASRGEVRTIILALKMAELELIENQIGQRPLLLLDDVFSELDGKRRKALTRFLSPYQTFITTTDADVIVQNFSGDCTIIPITKPSPRARK